MPGLECIFVTTGTLKDAAGYLVVNVKLPDVSARKTIVAPQ